MVAKERKKAHENRSKEGLMTGMRTSGETNSPPAKPVYTEKAQGEEKKANKRGAKIEPLSCGSASLTQWT